MQPYYEEDLFLDISGLRKVFYAIVIKFQKGRFKIWTNQMLMLMKQINEIGKVYYSTSFIQKQILCTVDKSEDNVEIFKYIFRAYGHDLVGYVNGSSKLVSCKT